MIRTLAQATGFTPEVRRRLAEALRPVQVIELERYPDRDRYRVHARWGVLTWAVELDGRILEEGGPEGALRYTIDALADGLRDTIATLARQEAGTVAVDRLRELTQEVRQLVRTRQVEQRDLGELEERVQMLELALAEEVELRRQLELARTTGERWVYPWRAVAVAAVIAAGLAAWWATIFLWAGWRP